jgi:hypothetical protein
MAYVSASRISAVALSTLAAWIALAGVDLGARSEGGWIGAGRAAILSVGADATPDVNRSGKGDRGALLPGAGDTTTLSFQLDGRTDGSVVMRLPSLGVKPVLGTGRPAANGARKPMIACEPMVSPLAAAARNLAPGRCVA